jgi:hypothetical protein
MNALKLAAGAAALLALAGCMEQQGTGNVTGRNGHAADVPAVKVLGAAESCISIARIQESRVRDDWTIDFRTGGNQWYRNTLPHRCNSLGFEKAFSYSTSLSQLCSTDIIKVIASTGGGIETRGSCGLGQFTPVEMVK